MNFRRWLKRQRGRDDRIGDLARDVGVDSEIPRYLPDLNAWRGYLEHNNACESALETLDLAWSAYAENKRSPQDNPKGKP